uniref:Uncharacterized protein n=1 Tax=Rhizophora mucronata TaxID=61149 RepID=A0A2P2IS59_RHIMU
MWKRSIEARKPPLLKKVFWMLMLSLIIRAKKMFCLVAKVQLKLTVWRVPLQSFPHLTSFRCKLMMSSQSPNSSIVKVSDADVAVKAGDKILVMPRVGTEFKTEDCAYISVTVDMQS